MFVGLDIGILALAGVWICHKSTTISIAHAKYDALTSSSQLVTVTVRLGNDDVIRCKPLTKSKYVTQVSFIGWLPFMGCLLYTSDAADE